MFRWFIQISNLVRPSFLIPIEDYVIMQIYLLGIQSTYRPPLHQKVKYNFLRNITYIKIVKFRHIKNSECEMFFSSFLSCQLLTKAKNNGYPFLSCNVCYQFTFLHDSASFLKCLNQSRVSSVGKGKQKLWNA